MPKINLSSVSYPASQGQYLPMPPGKYRVTCEQCDQTYNNQGIESWKLRFRVLDGPHKGRLIWDDLVWGSTKSEKANLAALGRCKLVFHRLGGIDCDTIGEADLVPEYLVGKSCVLELELEERDYRTGQPLPEERKRNRVAFAGYEADTGPVNSLDKEPTPF